MPAIGVLADHKTSSYHGYGTALYVATRLSKAHTISSFRRLTVKKEVVLYSYEGLYCRSGQWSKSLTAL